MNFWSSFVFSSNKNSENDLFKLVFDRLVTYNHQSVGPSCPFLRKENLKILRFLYNIFCGHFWGQNDLGLRWFPNRSLPSVVYTLRTYRPQLVIFLKKNCPFKRIELLNKPYKIGFVECCPIKIVR